MALWAASWASSVVVFVVSASISQAWIAALPGILAAIALSVTANADGEIPMESDGAQIAVLWLSALLVAAGTIPHRVGDPLAHNPVLIAAGASLAFVALSHRVTRRTSPA